MQLLFSESTRQANRSLQLIDIAMSQYIYQNKPSQNIANSVAIDQHSIALYLEFAFNNDSIYVCKNTKQLSFTNLLRS